MTPSEWVGVGGVGISVVSALVAWLTTRTTRLRDVENRLDEVEGDYAALWLWARQLVDHIYRGNPPPPPPPPERINNR